MLPLSIKMLVHGKGSFKFTNNPNPKTRCKLEHGLQFVETPFYRTVKLSIFFTCLILLSTLHCIPSIRGLLLPNQATDKMGVSRTDAGNLGAGIYFSDDTR